jgi:hypothetical protein
MRVSALVIYPLKGARAVPLDEVELEPLGPAGDRRYCLARPGGRAFTQRDDPRLARLQARHRAGGLALEFDGAALDVPADAFVTQSSVRVWSRQAVAHTTGGSIDAQLTKWFGTPLQLARLERPMQRDGAALAFGDAAALLATSAASLDALNAALAAPLPMDRFRPNIVVVGAAAYAEDGWGRLRVGDALLSPVHPCGRCEVTTIDQAFGAVLGDEPLRTLSRLRMQDGEAVFGVRYSVQRPGCVRVGDPVEALA